ncbi:MAG: anhydro-N-acetylmuramic acid kinase [Verrucomicrobiae bacterium]|nr:anhydro-N-acetylmuramic acid kinase [Verrucomicrobiae bacterium]
MKPVRWVLGLMSGTSLDGLDLVLCACRGPRHIALIRHEAVAFPAALRRRLHAAARGEATSWEAAQLHHDFGRFMASAAVATMPAGERPDAVGLHGQTVFHRSHRTQPATWQLGEPAYIAEALRVPVVSNFRAADLAVGGEGAPLATLFHRIAFAQRGQFVAVQNLGGIANVTALDWTDRAAAEPRVLSFDTGPGNVLMDLAMRELSGGRLAFDRDGRWAARGRVDAALVDRWLRHPYFRRPPPKSTGRELFGESFWRRAFAGQARRLNRHDLLVTLAAFTARSIALNYDRFLRTANGSLPGTVLLSGGGAANPVLRQHLGAAFGALGAGIRVSAVDDTGWHRQAIEGAAFALLAHYRLSGWPANLPETTGARRAVRLGQITDPGPAGAPL